MLSCGIVAVDYRISVIAKSSAGDDVMVYHVFDDFIA